MKKLKGMGCPSHLSISYHPLRSTKKIERGGVPPAPLIFLPTNLFGERRIETIKKIESLGAFHLIMNPTVDKRKLTREEEEARVDEILKKVENDLKFSKDSSLDEFGEKLHHRDQEKFTAQVQREELVRVCQSPSNYPQFTCDWFIEGLDFCCCHWRHEFKRPMTPPPLPRK